MFMCVCVLECMGVYEAPEDDMIPGIILDLSSILFTEAGLSVNPRAHWYGWYY